LPVRGEESGCAVPAGELWGAQVYVLQSSRSCVPFLQVLQGSSGSALQLQLYQCNCEILSDLVLWCQSFCVPCSSCCKNILKQGLIQLFWKNYIINQFCIKHGQGTNCSV
jgi:hypothetical protein